MDKECIRGVTLHLIQPLLYGDVDHDHKIILSGNSNTGEFETGDFAYNAAPSPITFNDIGTVNHFETDVNNDDPDFVMNGSCHVRSYCLALKYTF
jgi:hypothetical protein